MGGLASGGRTGLWVPEPEEAWVPEALEGTLAPRPGERAPEPLHTLSLVSSCRRWLGDRARPSMGRPGSLEAAPCL